MNAPDRAAKPKAKDLPAGIEFVAVQWVDIHGATKAKMVPRAAWEETAAPDGGAGFAGFANHGWGRGPEHPELLAIPDPAGVTPLPHREGIAVAFSTVLDGGEISGCDSRAILARVQTEAAARGFLPLTGIEPEFFLLRRTEQGSLAPFDALDALDKPCYDLKALLRSSEVMREIIDAMQGLGWGVTALDHEDGNGQFEINFGYAEALTTADRFTLLRTMIADIADSHGAIATFMPKPLSGRTGSGAHVHVSALAADGTNAFAPNEDPRGLGLSADGYRFVAGVLTHARGLCALTMPTVNSYRRLHSPSGTSGATWSPSTAVYGGNNRTTMLRIPGDGRFENRAVDSSCNPYLACAGLVAAGLDGIDRDLDPGEPVDGATPPGAGSALPATLAEAIDAFEADEVLVAALGSEAAAELISVKRAEWSEYMDSVSPWEQDTYLRRV